MNLVYKVKERILGYSEYAFGISEFKDITLKSKAAPFRKRKRIVYYKMARNIKAIIIVLVDNEARESGWVIKVIKLFAVKWLYKLFFH